MAMMALMTEVEFRVHRRDHALLVMPMCHANSLNFFTSFAYCGARITVFSRASFDAGLCMDRMGQGITFTSLVPTHYSMLLDVPAAQRGDVAGVEKLLVSSATAFAETKRAIIEMFPNSGLYELYGSTEAGWVTMLHPDEQFDHLGTVGREPSVRRRSGCWTMTATKSRTASPESFFRAVPTSSRAMEPARQDRRGVSRRLSLGG